MSCGNILRAAAVIWSVTSVLLSVSCAVAICGACSVAGTSDAERTK